MAQSSVGANITPPTEADGQQQLTGKYDDRNILTIMPAPTSRKELTHDRILDVAARAIRRAGYDGVGLASIMKEAGLTHGGFYAHFASRDALLAEATQRAGRDMGAVLVERLRLAQADGMSPFSALVHTYLADVQLENAECGYVVAALASEIPRQAEEVASAALRAPASGGCESQGGGPSHWQRSSAWWAIAVTARETHFLRRDADSEAPLPPY